MTRQAVVAAARTYLDTPYQHQARLPGVGLDCYGVVVVAYEAAGYPMRARYDYSPQPTEPELYAWMDIHFDRIALADVQPGDVLVFAMVREAQHMAMVDALSPVRMIHAYQGVGKVVAHELVAPWSRLLRSVHRLRAWQ